MQLERKLTGGLFAARGGAERTAAPDRVRGKKDPAPRGKRHAREW